MPSAELLQIADAVIESVEAGDTLSADLLSKFHCILPESLVLAALDLIDCESVIKCMTPQGYPQYEVLGSTASYNVFLDMAMSPTPFYCTCPAFAYAVLHSRSHLMCKHVLATRLANKLLLFVERPLTREDLQSMVACHFPDNNNLSSDHQHYVKTDSDTTTSRIKSDATKV